MQGPLWSLRTGAWGCIGGGLPHPLLSCRLQRHEEVVSAAKSDGSELGMCHLNRRFELQTSARELVGHDRTVRKRDGLQ